MINMYGVNLTKGNGRTSLSSSDENMVNYIAKVVVDISNINVNNLQMVGSLNSRRRFLSIIPGTNPKGVDELSGFDDVLIFHKPLPFLSVSSARGEDYLNGTSVGVSTYGNYSLYNTIELYIFGRIPSESDVNFGYGINVFNNMGDAVFSTNYRVITIEDSLTVFYPQRSITSNYQGYPTIVPIPSISNKLYMMGGTIHDNDFTKDGYTLGVIPFIRNNSIYFWTEYIDSGGSGITTTVDPNWLQIFSTVNVYDITPPKVYYLNFDDIT
ncbi:hypothetical protein M316_0114 [Nitrincola phage 1M3-16]|uniref:hypothetical protein n=1 Tax=Nitrincola phage 1M3-16 TaxID=1472912 RepID=UPI000444AF8F|nr:hypothetical protein GJ22_gp038 [Nitrincola phage 1M3-16]AHX01179.1 hypothetical protein M316_0114 [Nitrincola phage 1M3-16]